jgi:hypothetical protein
MGKYVVALFWQRSDRHWGLTWSTFWIMFLILSTIPRFSSLPSTCLECCVNDSVATNKSSWWTNFMFLKYLWVCKFLVLFSQPDTIRDFMCHLTLCNYLVTFHATSIKHILITSFVYVSYNIQVRRLYTKQKQVTSSQSTRFSCYVLNNFLTQYYEFHW